MFKNKKNLVFIFLIFCFNINFLSAQQNSGRFFLKPIKWVFSCFKKDKIPGLLSDANLLEKMPLSIWEKEILPSFENSLQDRDKLPNLCYLAQVLLLGKDIHKAIADLVIKRIIRLDRQINPETGLVTFYQILQTASQCLKQNPALRCQFKRKCSLQTNHKCLFCCLIRERGLYDNPTTGFSVFREINENFINAAKNGDFTLLKMLFLHGADIDAKSTHGDTALHKAAKKGHKEIIKFLIQNKTKINTQNDLLDTALSLAVEKNHSTIADFLLNNKTINVNLTNINKDSPLLFAMENENFYLIEKLLTKGAKTNLVNKVGTSVSNLAINTGDQNIITLLRKYG